MATYWTDTFNVFFPVGIVIPWNTTGAEGTLTQLFGGTWKQLFTKGTSSSYPGPLETYAAWYVKEG